MSDRAVEKDAGNAAGPEEPAEVERGGEGDAVSKLRHEAAGHRRKLRDAEAERDALAARLVALQRAEVERIAATSAEGFQPLRDGGDVWRGDDVQLEQVLDDGGNVEAAKVRELAERIGDAHPHWRSRVPTGDSDAGKGSPGPVEPDTPFAAGLKGAAR